MSVTIFTLGTRASTGSTITDGSIGGSCCSSCSGTTSFGTSSPRLPLVPCTSLWTTLSTTRLGFGGSGWVTIGTTISSGSVNVSGSGLGGASTGNWAISPLTPRTISTWDWWTIVSVWDGTRASAGVTRTSFAS